MITGVNIHRFQYLVLVVCVSGGVITTNLVDNLLKACIVSILSESTTPIAGDFGSDTLYVSEKLSSSRFSAFNRA